MKLKWKYDKKNRQWWTNEEPTWFNNEFTITKHRTGYLLQHDYSLRIFVRRLSSAKQIAELMRNG